MQNKEFKSAALVQKPAQYIMSPNDGMSRILRTTQKYSEDWTRVLKRFTILIWFCVLNPLCLGKER